mmetsp:Transcript_20674/g.33936  ORF Transcript_20674/g.33936 Transcript_20674/m.33936 type:complete len:474 (+) Transcript_20674:1100-2521(+)
MKLGVTNCAEKDIIPFIERPVDRSLNALCCKDIDQKLKNDRKQEVETRLKILQSQKTYEKIRINRKKKKVFYSNCKVLDVSGDTLMYCSGMRANTYIREGVAVLTEGQENKGGSKYAFPYCAREVQLTFKIRKEEVIGPDAFYVSFRSTRCVVCGWNHRLRWHFIVPYSYRRHFKDEFSKEIWGKLADHDRVIVCRRCCSVAEVRLQYFEKELGEKYDVPRRMEQKNVSGELSAKEAAKVLKRKGKKLMQHAPERYAELTGIVSRHINSSLGNNSSHNHISSERISSSSNESSTTLLLNEQRRDSCSPSESAAMEMTDIKRSAGHDAAVATDASPRTSSTPSISEEDLERVLSGDFSRPASTTSESIDDDDVTAADGGDDGPSQGGGEQKGFFERIVDAARNRSQATEEEGLKELIRTFRKHFMDGMNPQHMNPLWSEDHFPFAGLVFDRIMAAWAAHRKTNADDSIGTLKDV